MVKQVRLQSNHLGLVRGQCGGGDPCERPVALRFLLDFQGTGECRRCWKWMHPDSVCAAKPRLRHCGIWVRWWLAKQALDTRFDLLKRTFCSEGAVDWWSDRVKNGRTDATRTAQPCVHDTRTLSVRGGRDGWAEEEGVDMFHLRWFLFVLERVLPSPCSVQQCVTQSCVFFRSHAHQML